MKATRRQSEAETDAHPLEMPHYQQNYVIQAQQRAAALVNARTQKRKRPAFEEEQQEEACETIEGGENPTQPRQKRMKCQEEETIEPSEDDGVFRTAATTTKKNSSGITPSAMTIDSNDDFLKSFEDDTDLPLERGPETSIAFDAIRQYLNLLLHLQVRGDSRVLVVCPTGHDAVTHTISQIVRYHPVDVCGQVETVNVDSSSLPPVDAILETIKKQRVYLKSWDVVVCFGYNTNTCTEQAVGTWLDQVCDMVRGRGGRGRGHLFLELTRTGRENWQQTAKRFDTIGSTLGIRVAVVNSLGDITASTALRVAGRYFTLARILQRIPGGHHEKMIAYLRMKAIRLKRKISFVSKDLAIEDEGIYGVFLPQVWVGSEGWWDATGD